MEIVNIGLGILKNSNKNCKINSTSNSEKISKLIEKEIVDSYERLDFEFVEHFQEKALIEETPYYIDLKEISENHSFSEIKNIIATDNFLESAEQIKIDKKSFNSLEKNAEKVSFLVVETDNEFLFLAVGSRAIIRKKKLLDLSIGDGLNTAEINYGVPIPVEITGVLEKDCKRLYVLNVLDFERMIGVKQAKFEQANVILNKFISEEYKLGAEHWKVEFEDGENIRQNLYKQARNINRLSSYDDGQADFDIEKIQKAVNKLQEDKRIKFENNKVVVSAKSFNTFTAILYDAIVQRVLSGEYDIV